MFNSYLNTVPYSKFLLIEDNREEPGLDILNFIIKSRLKLRNYDIHYLIFEGCYQRKIIENAQTYDLASNLRNWKRTEGDQEKLMLDDIVLKLNRNSFIFIDSIVHMMLEYSFKTTYRLLRDIINNDGSALQIVAVFHTDILGDGKYLEYFQHLSTFFISLESKSFSGRPRIDYIYKKSGGKVIKQIEEYYFEDNVLKTEQVKKLNAQKLVNNFLDEVEPDKLTTFKISLEDDEKKAKEAVILPYLPKDHIKEEGGKIYYQFDEIDDWDEEDPDDDLNI